MTREAPSLPFVDEATVAELLNMDAAIDAIETAMRDLGAGRAENQPRRRLTGDGASLNMLAASWRGGGVYGQKIYSVGPGGSQFWVLLYHHDGRPLAIVAAQRLGRIRTGAATGVATRALARPDASVLGIIGTGYQMETQVEAVARVRKIEVVRAWSRDPARRAAFCHTMTERIGVPVTDAGSAEGAADGADVIVTLTTSSTPVLPTSSVPPGTHLVAAGSNHAESVEIDADTVGTMDVVVTDDVQQAKGEAGDLIAAERAGRLRWDDVASLADVMAEPSRGRTSPSERTLFKSNGIALWDVACAAYVARAAIDAGRTVPLPLATGPDAAAPQRFRAAASAGGIR